jgi:phage FluMu gp28-like protein
MRQDSYHNVIDTLIIQVKQSSSKMLKFGQEDANYIIHAMTIYDAILRGLKPCLFVVTI